MSITLNLGSSLFDQLAYIELAATSGKTYSATQLGEKLKLNAKRMNQLLSELGWISKSEEGWSLTEAGIRAGGTSREPIKSRRIPLWCGTT